MSVHVADCSFCGRHNNAIQVICELKCLVCAICMKSDCIRGLLAAGVRGDGVCTCPICDHTMAPNMAIIVKEFAEKNADEDDSKALAVARNVTEAANPFSLYFHKTLELCHFDPASLPSGLLTQECKAAHQRCNTLLAAVEDSLANKLTSSSVLEFLVDIYCLLWERHLRGATPESEPFYEIVTSNASAQKKKWGASSTDAEESMALTAAADADGLALASQGRATRLGKFKSLVDLLLQQLSFQVPSTVNGKGTMTASKSMRSSFSSAPKAILRNSLTRPSTVGPSPPGSRARTPENRLDRRPPSSSSSKGAMAMTRAESSSLRPATSGLLGGEAHPATLPAPPGVFHLALFGRMLGVFPAPVPVDRLALTSIVTNMLVHLTSPKLNVKRSYDGRPSLFANGTDPSVRDVQPALAEAVYGATTSSVPSAKKDTGSGFSMISIKKVIKFLSCLQGGIIDPHWALSPHKVPCVEVSAPVPWSKESVSKLLSLLLLRSSPASASGGNTLRVSTAGRPDEGMFGRRPSFGNLASDTPTRLDVLATIYETSNHIKQLWGEPLLTTTVKKQTPTMDKLASVSRASLGSRRMSSAVGAQLNLTESDVLSRIMPLKDYISAAVRAFNASSGQYGVLWPSSEEHNDHPLQKRGSMSMNFTTLSKDPVLSKLSDINFKSASRLAGNRVIDLGFAVYICIEAWTAEVKLVERNMSVAVSSSLRKTAMSLMSLNPDELRPLTLPEKKCLSDIITYYLLGETPDISNEEDCTINFGERSLSRLASFSAQNNQTPGEDVFASVDLIARGINWYMIRRNHKRRLQELANPAPPDDGSKRKVDGKNSLKAGVDSTPAEDAYLPPDSPALRSLLEFRDVELVHYTCSVAKTVVKRSLWDAHMSERAGWIDTFYWHPIQLVGPAAEDIADISNKGLSFEELYHFQRTNERNKSNFERQASMTAEREADLLDRSDLEAANMVDTSSESEEEEAEPVSAEDAGRTMKAMRQMNLRATRQGTEKAFRRKLFVKSHPLNYMNTLDNSTPPSIKKSKSRSADSGDDDSTTVDPRYTEVRHAVPIEPGFVSRGRVTTADKARRQRGTMHSAVVSSSSRRLKDPNNSATSDRYKSTLPVPKYLDSSGNWLKWAMTIPLNVDQVLASSTRQNPYGSQRDDVDDYFCDVAENRLDSVDHDQNDSCVDHSLWVASESFAADEQGGGIDIPVLDSITGESSCQRMHASQSAQSTLERSVGNAGSEVSLLAYFRGHKYDPPRTPASVENSTGMRQSKSEALLRVQSPVNAELSLASQLAIGSTAYAQTDPYYYSLKRNMKNAEKNKGLEKNNYLQKSGIGYSASPLQKPNSASTTFTTSSNPTITSVSSVGSVSNLHASSRLEKSSIASALTRLAERTGRDTYLTSAAKQAKMKQHEGGIESLKALNQAYATTIKHNSVVSNVLNTIERSRGASDPESTDPPAKDVVIENDVSMAPVVSSGLYMNVRDAWSGSRVNVAGSSRNTDTLVYGMTDIISNNAAIMSACGALPRLTREGTLESDEDSAAPQSAVPFAATTTTGSRALPVIDSGNTAWKLNAERNGAFSGMNASEFHVLLRPQSPTYIYDRGTLDLGHFSHPSTAEIPPRTPCILSSATGSRRISSRGGKRATSSGERPDGLQQIILRESKLTKSEFEQLFENSFSSTLRRLDLYGSTVSKPIIQILTKYFSEDCGLEDLCLGKNKLSDTMVVSLLQSLKAGGGCRTLKKLDLKDNCGLVVNSPAALLTISQFTELQFLDLSGNRFNLALEANKTFSTVLQDNLTKLRALSMACIAMGDPGAAIVLQAATNHKSLRLLDLSNCLITSAGSENVIIQFLKSTRVSQAADLHSGSASRNVILLLHGIIWSGSTVEPHPGAEKDNVKITQHSGSSRQRILEVATEHEVQVVFDGLYEGIDLVV